MPHLVALRRLDLDNVGTEIAKDFRRHRSEHCCCDVNDADPPQRAGVDRTDGCGLGVCDSHCYGSVEYWRARCVRGISQMLNSIVYRSAGTLLVSYQAAHMGRPERLSVAIKYADPYWIRL